MGLKDLEKVLRRHPRLGLDSMTLIYLLEDKEPYASSVELALRRIEKGDHTAYVSSLVLTELLIPALRQRRYETVHRYRQFLLSFPNLQTLPLDIPTAELAASLRAKYDIRTPDAVHVATSLQNGASAFLTNDKQLSRITGIEIILLDHYI